MDSITLKLYDYLLGDCPHEHCIHNENEVCVANRDLLYENLPELIKGALNTKTGLLENINAICYEFKIKDSYCTCGEKLVGVTDMVPYGDTHIPYRYLECQNC